MSALCLFQFTANAQKLPDKQEKYEFLHWYLTRKGLKQLSDTTVPFSIGSLKMKEIDRILAKKLTQAELRYLHRQIISTKIPNALDTMVFKRYDLITIPDAKAFRSYISMPIFSKDRKMALIAYGIYCGITCGEESIDVYIKTQKGSWKESHLFAFPVVMF